MNRQTFGAWHLRVHKNTKLKQNQEYTTVHWETTPNPSSIKTIKQTHLMKRAELWLTVQCLPLPLPVTLYTFHTPQPLPTRFEYLPSSCVATHIACLASLLKSVTLCSVWSPTAAIARLTSLLSKWPTTLCFNSEMKWKSSTPVKSY